MKRFSDDYLLITILEAKTDKMLKISETFFDIFLKSILYKNITQNQYTYSKISIFTSNTYLRSLNIHCALVVNVKVSLKN